jgi:hypothetical protein
MKPSRRLIPVAALVILVAVVAGRRPGTRYVGFATPEDCVTAHAQACKDGDVPAYLACLSGPLLDEARRLAQAGTLPAALRRSLAGVKSWVLAGSAAAEGDSATAEVDLVRPEGTRRVRFRLARTPAGWRIVAVDAPRDLPTPVRYGTHVSAIPEGRRD